MTELMCYKLALLIGFPLCAAIGWFAGRGVLISEWLNKLNEPQTPASASDLSRTIEDTATKEREVK